MNIMKTNRKYKYIVSIMLFLAVTSCNKDFLKPEPLSFFSPENVLMSQEGMESLLTACEEIFQDRL